MNIQEFIQLINEDSELAQKMSGATNPDEAYDIAKEAGLTDSFEVFTDTMTKIYKAQSELSEEELDAIVGGSDNISADVSVTIFVSALGTLVTTGSAAAV